MFVCSPSTIQPSTRQPRAVAANVITPAREVASAVAPAQVLPPASPALTLTPAELLEQLLAPVKADMVQMDENLRDVVGNRHAVLRAASGQIFQVRLCGWLMVYLLNFLTHVSHKLAQQLPLKGVIYTIRMADA
jgi:hypothetical protein